MIRGEIIAALTALANGLDPTTGASVSSGCPCQQPLVIRALFNAVRLLERPTEENSIAESTNSLSLKDAAHIDETEKRRVIAGVLSRVLLRAAALDNDCSGGPPQRATAPKQQPIGLAEQYEREVRRLVTDRQTAAARGEKCPDRCGNCESPLRSWGEYVNDHRCVWCENSGREW